MIINRWLILIILLLPLILTTSCFGSITDTMEFGGGVKVPAILVYIGVFFGLFYYLTHRKK